MTDTRSFIVGVVCGIATVALVYAMSAPVDSLGRGIASVLRSSSSDIFAIEPSWGVPRWLLRIDGAFGGVFLAIIFFGGLPIALVAFAIRVAVTVVKRAVLVRLVPYGLVFQVSSVLLALVTTIVGASLGGGEYLSSGWAWYQAATLIAGAAAIPVWQRMPRPVAIGVTFGR
jgi:hypothetical protein